MGEEKKTKRLLMMLAGNLLIGVGVAFYRISGFGADPYTCMNLGVSGFLGMSFGNWQLLMNIILLAAVWFTVRNCIGLGTLVNMVFVGYTADFLCWLLLEQLGLSVDMSLRIVFLLLGMLFLSFGCACYMSAEMGIAPYDSAAFIITKYAGERVSFRAARIATDVTVVIVGIVFCVAGGNSVWQAAGLGTVICAFCNGPLIQYFRSILRKRE